MKQSKLMLFFTLVSLSTSAFSAETELSVLSAQLKKSDLKTKYEAIEKIKAIRTAEAAHILAVALKREKDANVRLTLLDEINALGFASVVPDLVPALNDKNVAIRQRAVRVISRLGGPAADEALLAQQSTESDAEVKSAVNQALNGRNRFERKKIEGKKAK